MRPLPGPGAAGSDELVGEDEEDRSGDAADHGDRYVLESVPAGEQPRRDGKKREYDREPAPDRHRAHA